MTFEKWLSEIIESKRINLSKMAREIGIPYHGIYNSLRGKRNLRSGELIAICRYIEVNPMDFEGGDLDAKGSS